MACLEFLEEYKGVTINKDNMVKSFRVTAVILKEQLKNPGNINYSKLLTGGSVEIIRRKIDKVVKNE